MTKRTDNYSCVSGYTVPLLDKGDKIGIENDAYTSKKLSVDEKTEYIQSGKFKAFRAWKYSSFSGSELQSEYIDICKNLQPYEIYELQKMYDAKKRKRSRAGDRLQLMFNYSITKHIPVYFVTLTFNDDALERSNAVSKRKAVQKFFTNSDALDYYANIDFGEQKGREHYHAVVLGNVNYEAWESTYGFVKIEQVNTTDSDRDKLKKYINKFENHATKDSVKASNVITKRGVNKTIYSDMMRIKNRYKTFFRDE